jgi:hypothetical protein
MGRVATDGSAFSHARIVALHARFPGDSSHYRELTEVVRPAGQAFAEARALQNVGSEGAARIAPPQRSVMSSHPEALRLLEILVGPKHISYVATADGASVAIEGPETRALLEFEQRTRTARQSPAGTEMEQRFLRDFVACACVPALDQALRSARARTPPFLFVHVSNDALSRLPWEAIPTILDLPDTTVVRVTQTLPEPDQTPPATAGARGRELGLPAPLAAPETSRQKERMLLVTSPRRAGRTLPSLAAEAGDVCRAAVAGNMDVTTMVEPKAGDVLRKLASVQPQRLHLSVATLDETAGAERLQVGEDAAGAEWLNLSDVCGQLHGTLVQSAVVSAGSGGLSVCGRLCAAGARAAVGWSGWVDDEQMRRFSVFFYQRIFEGYSPAAAVHIYFATVLRRGADRLSGTPMVWLRAPDLSAVRSVSNHGRLESQRGLERDPRATGLPAGATGAPDGIQVEVRARSALNPALIKNGCPAVEHLVITSPTNRSGVRLSIVCDTGFSTSSYVRQISLLAGTQQVMTEDAHFPCLHELLAREGGRRQVNFIVTLRDRDNDRVLVETTRSVLCMGGREWLDDVASWAYLPAFVLPYSSGTQDVVSKARATLRLLGCGADDFMAYYAKDPADVDRQAESIFKTLQTTYGIRYMPPPGLGVYEPAAARRAGQFVRLPADILEHRWGTCHDLALLFAGCLEHVGIRPLIVLTGSHTFAGYWREPSAHGGYWRSRAGKPAAGDTFGSGWTIRDTTDFDQLLRDRSITLVETTHVTQPQRTYMNATSAHVDMTDSAKPHLLANDFQAAIDIRASRTAIQPL